VVSIVKVQAGKRLPSEGWTYSRLVVESAIETTSIAPEFILLESSVGEPASRATLPFISTSVIL
jgi:hypothetical protein